MAAVAVLVATLACLLAGSGGFLLAAGGVGDGAVRCGPGRTPACMPRLDPEAVRSVLTGRGFDCDLRPGYWHCRLLVGGVEYTLGMHLARNGLAQRLQAVVGQATSQRPSPRAQAFLTWAAALPAASADRARLWVAGQLTAERDATTTIDGYEYTLDLSLRAIPDAAAFPATGPEPAVLLAVEGEASKW